MEDRLQTAQRVADSLFEAERAMDVALARVADAVSTSTAARGQLGVGYKVGAAGIAKLAGISAELAHQREVLADAHNDFSAVQRFIRVRPNMTGGGEKGPNQDDVPFLSEVKAA